MAFFLTFNYIYYQERFHLSKFFEPRLLIAFFRLNLFYSNQTPLDKCTQLSTRLIQRCTREHCHRYFHRPIVHQRASSDKSHSRYSLKAAKRLAACWRLIIPLCFWPYLSSTTTLLSTRYMLTQAPHTLQVRGSGTTVRSGKINLLMVRVGFFCREVETSCKEFMTSFVVLNVTNNFRHLV
jgi:hypothetical protein